MLASSLASIQTETKKESKTMKFLTIVSLVAFTIAPALAQQPKPSVPDLVGIYKVAGQNPDKSGYEGCVEIVRVRDTFRVLWTMSDGQILGVGIWSNGVFVASYFGGAPGVIVYKLDDNKLIGEWTMGGAEGEMYSEILTKADECSVPRPQGPPPTTPRPAPAPGTQVDKISI
ncbi:MAG: hypothetical protein A3B86_04725 [Candidatus Yanofskybacteria bacterium RIFCSPHIGHO2_02_FULL_38_22b]|uniref:Uncharacterized protein n=1 Tax=Candidatus Yanofskybacteria bacterium RIFCSPHIGHO2_02_FULL_38_22b TaxID=1802673 RepID=A0A1F8F312_9BACT|nr:MAG: hypothetical protein A2816_01200 [Candidatus Yanofskybacteria bacterium RIFCSPHIGHO2_01_FULL_39_44]OGN07517.1 MAG: hypothetical protein A3B86_04725 [Candidatus Yanofskybacteria bacterium RIFCSPHIGHO2_02_FULL_38_22b]